VASVAASWPNWDVIVKVSGNNISDNLVDGIQIDAQRSAARTADFSVLLSGVIDALSWVGRPVSIDFKQDSGAVWRRFTGVISIAVYDIASHALKCTCSDDLQRVIDARTNEQLKTLIGGYWSPYVFNEKNIGWNYCQDLLKTVQNSAELDSSGVLKVNSLQNKAVADFSFDTGIILDESLSVELTQRAQLVNRIDITFQSRFERLYHRTERQRWQYPHSIVEYYSNTTPFLNQGMVADAVANAGWSLLSADYSPIWPSGIYDKFGQVTENIYFGLFVWVNNYPDAVLAFDLDAAFRWQQSVTHEFNITVSAPASIAAYGAQLTETIDASASVDSVVSDWGKAGTDLSVMPSGFVRDDQYNYYRDEYQSADVGNALKTLVAEAATRIAESHRSSRVVFNLPLAPYLELNHTVAVNDADVTAKGIVNRISERYSFDEGRATTTVELAISAGQTGVDIVEFTPPDLAIPALPSPANNSDPRFLTDVPTHIGGIEGAPPDSEAFFGYMTNYDLIGPGSNTYPQELRLMFNALPDDKTIDITTPISYAVEIAVPHNTLTIHA
jgi:hypothetical protein